MVEYNGEMCIPVHWGAFHFLLENMNILREDWHKQHLTWKPYNRLSRPTKTWTKRPMDESTYLSHSIPVGKHLKYEIYYLHFIIFWSFPLVFHRFFPTGTPALCATAEASDAELPKGLDGQHGRRHRSQTQAPLLLGTDYLKKFKHDRYCQVMSDNL